WKELDDSVPSRGGAVDSALFDVDWKELDATAATSKGGMVDPAMREQGKDVGPPPLLMDEGFSRALAMAAAVKLVSGPTAAHATNQQQRAVSLPKGVSGDSLQENHAQSNRAETDPAGSAPPPKSGPGPEVIGGAVGGSIAFIIIVVVGVVLYLRRRKAAASSRRTLQTSKSSLASYPRSQPRSYSTLSDGEGSGTGSRKSFSGGFFGSMLKGRKEGALSAGDVATLAGSTTDGKGKGVGGFDGVKVYRVGHPYNAKLPDELELRRGDEVEPGVPYDDGWCVSSGCLESLNLIPAE
ncbi:hypothetical protein HDU67_009683, partial [Dinochytrium kinnereticum]